MNYVVKLWINKKNLGKWTIPSHLLTWDYQVLQYWSTTVLYQYILCSNVCVILYPNMYVLYSNTVLCTVSECVCTEYRCVLYSNMYCIRIPVCIVFEYVLYSNMYCIRIPVYTVFEYWYLYVLYSNTCMYCILMCTVF